jgi:GNAT superfamily N-acetyltransferase
MDAVSNAVVITDDDDELNPWGQAGTLDGLQGEIVGYTVVELHQDANGYHLLCKGAVHPDYRRRNAGRALIMSALNRAHTLAAEFEFEAEEAGYPIYFEALFPVRDPASARLAAKCEMEPTFSTLKRVEKGSSSCCPQRDSIQTKPEKVKWVCTTDEPAPAGLRLYRREL